MPDLAPPADPPPFLIENEGAGSPFLLLCEHASNYIPARYERLGLDPAELERHIAYDIGAAAIARQLSRRLDAVLFLGTHSRLLIDLNRPAGVPSSIPEISEATRIPGNVGITADERLARETWLLVPFHAAVSAYLDRREQSGLPTTIIAVHSMTNRLHGIERRMQAAVLFGRAEALAHRFAAALAPAIEGEIGMNEPYRVTVEGDFSVPVHGDARGLPALALEARQDLVGDAAGQALWAQRFGDALRALLADPSTGRPQP